MIRVKKSLKTILIAVATIAIIVSCATKPKPPAPEPVAPPAPAAPAQPQPAAAPAVSQDDLDKLMAEAKDLKKKSFDLKLFEVLPDDYKAAEALYEKGAKSYDDKDAPAAKEGLGAAIAAYKDLISRGIVDIAAAKKKDAEDMKATAIKAGADSSQPERFGAGDDAFKSAADLVDASKAEEAIPGFEQALLYYELAWKRAVASDLKKGIEDKDYAKWDSGNYQLADNKYQAEDGYWASGNAADRASGVDALDEAILRFNLVVQKGRETAVATVKAKTDASKQRSEDIKANVAVKDMYDSAQVLYGEGSSQLAAKDYEAAADSYDRAGAGFDQAYQAAAEKRATAEAAMKAADEATTESQRKAKEAEPLLQANPPDNTPATAPDNSPATAPDNTPATAPDDSSSTSPDNSPATAPDDSSSTSPDNSPATAPDDSSTTTPDNSSTTTP